MDALSNASLPCRLRWLAAVAACWLCALAPAASLTDATKPISLDAASTNFDYRNNLLTFRKVRIAQDGMSVEADEATATGLDFENSEWKFMGAVHIRMPNGALESDSATITFRNNQITRARIAGSPAVFQQERVEQQVARGRAGTIEYDVTRGTIELKEQAWLSDGKNEITGQTLVYDMVGERVIANPGEQDPGGVSITINPRSLPAPPAPPRGGTP